MDNNTKVSFNQIEIANKEMVLMPIGSKQYAPVNERIKAFRKVYPNGSIETYIEDYKEDSVRMRAEIQNEEGKIIAIGRACERKTNSGINSSRMVENCETSAIGRALGMAGFGVDSSVASAEDIEKANDEKKSFCIAKGMYISSNEAINQIRLSINEIYKIMGMRVQDLNDKLEELLWTTLNDMNANQLLKLEQVLKTANMENSVWHELYNQNTKAKNVIPINQQVVYKTSWQRFGEMALKMCGTDEVKRQQVIEEYYEMEIDLGNSYVEGKDNE